MTRNNFVTALGFIVLGFIALTLITSGGAGGGSTDCGPGYSYDAERGCRKIKSIGKKKVMPGAEQAPEQAQPDTSENN